MKGLQKPHVVAVPFPALGHIIPFLDLAKLLALQGAMVSYVTTPANASRLKGTLIEAQSAGLDIPAVVLPTPAVEGLQEGRESADVIPSVDVVFNLAKKLAEPFERWLHQQLRECEEETGAVRPVCIISDIFMLWTLDTGEKYGIPRVLFNTFGAFATSLIDSVSASISQNALQKEGDSVVLSMNLPSPLRFNKKEIATGFFEYDRSNPRQQFVIQCFQSLSRGWGIFIRITDRCIVDGSASQRAAIRLGHQSPPTRAVTTAAAEVNPAYLPHGFEERMKYKGLGLIIWGWAPQLLILSHRSIGAFMTHCGWNSTLDSITLGVPMIAWPMFGDQHFNSKQVAEQFGTGVKFCEHRDGIPDEERVKEVVRLVLTEDEGEEMRRRAEKLKEMASKAVADDGSSKANLRTFVCEMQKLIKSPNTKNEIGDTESMPTVRA